MAKMKSLRLDDELASKVASAARMQKVNESEFIRRALEEAVTRTKRWTLRDALADVIGTVPRGGIGDSRRVDEGVLAEILKDKQRWNRLHLDPCRR